MTEPPDTATGGRGIGLTTGYANWCEAAAVRAAIEFMPSLSQRAGSRPMRLAGVPPGAFRSHALGLPVPRGGG